MPSETEKKDLDHDLHEVFKLRRKLKEDYDFINGVATQFERERKKKKYKITSITLAVASILILSFWVFSPKIFESDSKELFNKYYQSFDPDVLTRDLAEMELLDKGIVFYVEGDIQKALVIFKEIKLSDDENATLDFFMALALLEDNQLDHSREILENLEEQKDFLPIDVLWYLGMINLKQQNYEEVKTYFNEISDLDKKAYKGEIRKIKRKIRFK